MMGLQLTVQRLATAHFIHLTKDGGTGAFQDMSDDEFMKQVVDENGFTEIGQSDGFVMEKCVEQCKATPIDSNDEMNFIIDEEDIQEISEMGPTSSDGGSGSGVNELNGSNFHSVMRHGIHLVEFFAPWCVHCRNLQPTIEQLAKTKLVSGSDIHVDTVDCTKYPNLCQDNGIAGYPTLLVFKEGVRVDDYNGRRSLEALEGYLRNMNQVCGNGNCGPDELAKKTEARALIRFYDDGAWVKNWIQLASRAKKNNLVTGEVNCRLNPELCKQIGKETNGSSLLAYYNRGDVITKLETTEDTSMSQAWSSLKIKPN